jgi:Tfp pilus assembly protein PilX
MSDLLRLRLRAASEEGMALVLAVLILAVVSVIATSAILYTSTSQRDAYSKKARQKAYTLAEAALSNATAQLTAQYYDSTGTSSNNAVAAPTAWIPADTSQQSPTSSTHCTIGSATTTCMSWTATVSTAGVTGIQRAFWTLTGRGSVPNPSGSVAIKQTVSEVIPVTQPVKKVPPPDIWKGIYSGAPASAGCDLTTGQGVIWVSPVYVVGNLCIQQSSGVESPGILNVGGWIQDTQSGHAGTSSSPLPTLNIAGACNGTQGSTPACSPAWDSVHNYYADASHNIYATSVSNSPTFPSPPPSVDWSKRALDSGIGSNPQTWSCTGGKSLTSATFDLTGSAYSCTTPSGSLTWDGTANMTINGNVYITGNLTTSNNTSVAYRGVGGLYVGGTITFGNNTAICVGSVVSGVCPQGYSWDASQDIFLFLSQGGITGANFNLEGGLYSDNDISFSAGQTAINGPIVTAKHLLPGQQASSGFPNITSLPSGAPLTPDPYYVLGAATSGTY